MKQDRRNLSPSVCAEPWLMMAGLGLCASLMSLAACADGDPAGTTTRRGATAPVGTAGSPSASPAFAGNTATIAPVYVPPANAGTTGVGAGCVAGHYVGSFSGAYNSAAWGNGSFPLSVEAVPSMGRPGLEFWLEQASGACAPGSEFCADYTVKGGRIRGFANPFSDPNAPPADPDAGDPLALAIRFEIDFGGELDCSSGQFKGLLQNGCYDVATVLFRFEGTAPATYDQASTTFKAGEWSVKELPMPNVIFPPDSKIGGMGTWQATLSRDNATPEDVNSGFCHM